MARQIFLYSVPILLLIPQLLFAQSKENPALEPKSLYDFTMKTIDGKEKPLAEYKGKVLLVVNVASQCGYTPQYKDLEEVYRQYESKGFRILAFPANNFGQQEPGSDSEIKTFCESKYNVTFDMFSKISVEGNDQDPMYRYITKDSPYPGEIQWNFQKYLVDKHGAIVARFPSRVKPTDPSVTKTIETLLAQSM